MQRRTGKGLAHISISPGPGHTGFPDSEKTPSRLRQKSLGVTNRIWLILFAFVALVVFTRSVIPQESAHARQRTPHSDLKPKNYLNFSEDAPNPFPFCPALGPADDLATKYDPIVLSTTRFHLGSGARIQRVINKALSGLPVTISVVGGSGEHLVPTVFFHPRHPRSISPKRATLMSAHVPFISPRPVGVMFLEHTALSVPEAVVRIQLSEDGLICPRAYYVCICTMCYDVEKPGFERLTLSRNLRCPPECIMLPTKALPCGYLSDMLGRRKCIRRRFWP